MDYGPWGQTDLPQKARFYYKGAIFLRLITEFFLNCPFWRLGHLWAPKCCQSLPCIGRTIAPSSSSEQEVFPFPGGLRPGRPDLAWAVAVPASAPGLSQKQGLPGFTHCPRGGDSRTCCPHGRSARVQVSWQSPAHRGSAQCPLSVPANSPSPPLFLSSLQVSQPDSPFSSCFLLLLFWTHLPLRNAVSRG